MNYIKKRCSVRHELSLHEQREADSQKRILEQDAYY